MKSDKIYFLLLGLVIFLIYQFLLVDDKREDFKDKCSDLPPKVISRENIIYKTEEKVLNPAINEELLTQTQKQITGNLNDSYKYLNNLDQKVDDDLLELDQLAKEQSLNQQKLTDASLDDIKRLEDMKNQLETINKELEQKNNGVILSVSMFKEEFQPTQTDYFRK